VSDLTTPNRSANTFRIYPMNIPAIILMRRLPHASRQPSFSHTAIAFGIGLIWTASSVWAADEPEPGKTTPFPAESAARAADQPAGRRDLELVQDDLLRVSQLAFSPDGQRLAIGGSESLPQTSDGSRRCGTVKLWDLARQGLAFKLRDVEAKRPESDGTVTALRFSPDG